MTATKITIMRTTTTRKPLLGMSVAVEPVLKRNLKKNYKTFLYILTFANMLPY